jgi:hypothetical protein
MFPLLLSVDLVPHGLRKAVGPKISTISGRDLLRHMAADFENAVERAAREAGQAANRKDEPATDPPAQA